MNKQLSHSAWMICAQAIGVIAGLFSTIIVARELGIQAYGNLVTALTIVTILGPLAQMGITSIVTNELVNRKEYYNEIITAAWLLRLVGTAIAGLSALLIIKVTGIQVDVLLIGIGILGCQISAIAVVNNIKMARGEFESISRHQIVSSVSGLILKVAAAIVTAKPAWVMVANSVASGIAGLSLAISLKREKFKFIYDADLTKKVMSGGVSILMAHLLSAMYMRVDHLMIASMINVSELSHYALAAKITEIAQLIPLAILTVITPGLFKNPKIEQYAEAYRALIISGLLVVIAIWLFRVETVNLLFGSQYSGSLSALSVLIFSAIPAVIGVGIGQHMISINRTKYLTLITMIGLLTNLTLNVVLIPEYGIVGASWATLISYSVAAYCGILIPGLRPVRKALMLAHWRLVAFAGK